MINRKNALSGQTFVYHIQADNLDMYVTLQCDENGKGSVEVLEVTLDHTYTVTELKDWSWRFEGQSISQSNSGTVKKLTYDFEISPSDLRWLNGCSPEKENVYQGKVVSE